MTKIYGIKNCDTMKKAFKWLEANGKAYEFHDYKKDGVDADILKRAINDHGWEIVINQRGTTWRKLPDDVKDAMDKDSAVKVALANPSIVKRPLLIHEDHVYLGFKDEIYNEIF